MKTPTAKFQLGKQGLTDNFIESIDRAFDNKKQIRISVLKSATRNKDELLQFAQDLQKKLSKKVNFRVIGYTIILIKQ